MGMTLLTNTTLLETKIAQLGERAVKGMSDKMRKHAVLVRNLARDYAPVRSGMLEDNIDYVTVKDGRRNAYVVFVRLEAPRTRSNAAGQTRTDELGDYAPLMEEGLSPYGRGRYKLGKRSRAKRASGKKVGGRFLARAVKDGTKTLMPELVDAVRRITGGTGFRS